ncbi:hypothetical protein L7F22_020348 [Adiantum nelumboides]|nr:hypothetical protein [Adiantum nelumboides]
MINSAMKRDPLLKERPPPLKIIKHKDPSFNVQKRKPVIIHTYSPEVINVEACNFMQIVQRLTGRTASSPPASKKLKPAFAEEPSLISLESPQSENNASLDHMKDEWLEQGYPRSYRNFILEGNLYIDGTPNPNGSDSLHPNLNGDGAFSPDHNRNPNPNSALPSSARTSLSPPFVKPFPLLSHCGSFKQISCVGEASSPFLWSPSLFDLSPSRLPSPSTFFSPFPAISDDFTSFVS